MKTLTSLMTALVMLCTSLPALHAQEDPEITVDYFYNALAPYGDWVHVEGYGYCFQPRITVEDPEWRPYTDGNWAYTDGGWTWVSNEDFGWACYHYGRWMRAGNNWLWIPGTEWAPAWVSWRTNDEYVGWAPLPPEAVWRPEAGFSVEVDAAYDIGPSCYCFVPVRYLGAPRIRQYVQPWQRNVDFMRRTENCTHITYRRADAHVGGIFIGGPSYVEVSRYTETPLRRMNIRRDERFNPRDRDSRSWRAREEDGALIVAAPRIAAGGDRGIAPPEGKVKARLQKGAVDRGWKGVKAEDAGSIREKLKKEVAESGSRSRRSGSPPDAGGPPAERRGSPDDVPKARPVPLPGEVPKALPPGAIPGRGDGSGPGMRRPGDDNAPDKPDLKPGAGMKRPGDDSPGRTRVPQDPPRPPVGPTPGAKPRDADSKGGPDMRKEDGGRRPGAGGNTVSPQVPRPGGAPPVNKPDMVPPSKERRMPPKQDEKQDGIPGPGKTRKNEARPDAGPPPAPVPAPTPRRVSPPEAPKPKNESRGGGGGGGPDRKPEMRRPEAPSPSKAAPEPRGGSGGGGGSRGSEKNDKRDEDKGEKKGRR